jgi:uncharacterized peroxidase-related enzyme
MAFIETTPIHRTLGDTRAMLARQQKHFGYVPNYAKLFTDRTDVMDLWAALLAGIRSHIAPRPFELATFAAAIEIKSTYCALAHGRVLEQEFLTAEEVAAIAVGDYSGFSEADAALLELARKVASDTSTITEDDIDRLRQAGYEENEIFDVVAAASARCFFAKLVDGLGAQPDAPMAEMDPGLVAKLVVGRAVANEEVVRLEGV